MLANVAPAVLARLRGRAPSGAPPEGAQLKVNLLLARLPRLRDAAVDPGDAFAGTFHVNEGYAQLERARAQAAAGALPDVVPCEIYCHSLTDPWILGPELQAAGAQTLTCSRLHLPARLFAADPEGARERALAATLALAGQRARRADPRLRVARRRRAPVRGGAQPARPRGRARAAGRQHLPPRPDLALRRDRGRGRHLGRRDRRPARADLRRRRRRGGGVSGIPGRNAAMAVLGD